MISCPKIVSKCCLVLYNNIKDLTDGQFWSVIDGSAEGSHNLDFSKSTLALDIALVSQRVFYSIQKGETKWFGGFIMENLEKFSSSTKIDGLEHVRIYIEHIRIFMQLVILMLKYVPKSDQSIILASLFLNLCTSVACSVINTLWLFNLLNVLLSKDLNEFNSEMLKQFIDFRENWTEQGRNFSEIKGTVETILRCFHVKISVREMF